MPTNNNNPRGHPQTIRSTQWKPGQSGNPAGHSKGRVELQAEFWKMVATDWAKHGQTAIEEARKADPATYFKVVASLMPRELDIKSELNRMSDEDIYRAIDELRALIASGSIRGEIAGEAGESEAPLLPSVQ